MKFNNKNLLLQKKVVMFFTDTCCFQTSGEAQYVSDIPTQGGELCGAFVVSTQVGLRHKRLLDTYIHTLLFPPQKGFSGTIIIYKHYI